MAFKTYLRPLASVGAFAFDVELGNSRGDERAFSQRTIPTGATVIDHSMINPGGRRFTLTGAVSNSIQPQNVGRKQPGGGVADRLEALIGQVALGFVGMSTRLADAENLLRASILEGEEVEVVSKKFGKIRAIVLSWQAQDGEDDGGASTYQVELLEVRRAGGLFFSDPNAIGEALNGSGATNDVGPTTAVDEAVEFTP